MSAESIVWSIRGWAKACLWVGVVVALLFCFALWTCTSLQANSETTLSYAIIGASGSEGLLFRTVFHFMNESGETLTAQLLVFSTDGSAQEITTSSNWAREEGTLQQNGNQVGFSVPTGSSLELALVPPSSDSYAGWAKVQFEGDLAVRTVVQVGQLTYDSLPPPSLPSSSFPPPSFHFEHFLESRCPIDVTCIQAGQARVMLRVLQSGQTLGEVILSTTLDGNEESVGAYSIRLIKVEPVPIFTRRIDISEYRLTLLVTKI